MTKYLLLAFSLFIYAALSSEAQKNFTMEEAVLGVREELAPEQFRQLNWIPAGAVFTRELEREQNPALLGVKVPDMEVDTILKLKELNRRLWNMDSLDRLPEIHWLNDTSYWFQVGHFLYKGHYESPADIATWHELPVGAKNIIVDKTNAQVAYTLGSGLYLVSREGDVQKVGKDSLKSIIYGQSVHRNEFGISGGIFFSPKGNYLAFYRMDESGVEDYPIIDWSSIPAASRSIKYPMAGRRSHEVRLGVYNPKQDKIIYLDTDGPADQYLTSVTWSPDERYIFVALLNREQNHLKLNRYHAETGRFEKTLFEEHQDKYVEPQHPLLFLPGENSEFIWWSQREGFMHLYRYDIEGKLLNQVTRGDWLVNEIAGVNAGEKSLIIAASKVSPLSRNIFKVNWRTGKMKRLDKQEGQHTALVNGTGKYWIDRFSSDTIPNRIQLAETKGSWVKQLLNAEDPLKAYERPEIKQVELQAEDGTVLYGKVIYPVNFNPETTYPVIVYLYNGPHVQLIQNKFPASGNLWFEYLAQRGYLVFTMDGRGSSNRGLAFEQTAFRKLGTVEMEDQLRGVAYLKSLKFVDPERIGVHGWSFGGFMTTSLMLRHPGVFKVGVAGGPVMDWSMYEVMYTERYMDTPEQNPEGYTNSALFDKVDHLQGKLLLIHGAQDDVVVWQHSMKFIESCIKKGVQVDYFVYPSHPHNVRGKDRVHLMQKITDYFDTYLK